MSYIHQPKAMTYEEKAWQWVDQIELDFQKNNEGAQNYQSKLSGHFQKKLVEQRAEVLRLRKQLTECEQDVDQLETHIKRRTAI